MTDTLRIASIQANPPLATSPGNLARAQALVAEAEALGADIALFPELFLIGYPPEDLVLKPAAVADCAAAVSELAASTAGRSVTVLIGAPWRTDEGLFNAVLVLADGRIEAVRLKHDLPNYAVFDEKRVFTPGPLPAPVSIKGVWIGVPVCEDIWDCAGLCGPEIGWSRVAAGAQRLAFPPHGPCRAAGDGAGAGGRDWPAAGLSQSGGWTG